MNIRPGTVADAADIARICLLTGEAGGDATGLHGDDALLADIYAVPYLHDPAGFALVAESDEGDVIGYVLGTADTDAFQRWFSAEWWPGAAREREAQNERGEAAWSAAGDPERCLEAERAEFPAHLHIDLLPSAQGRGLGRRLIDEACALLGERGVPGVHLVPDPRNAGARAFYPRVGFDLIQHAEDHLVYVRRIPT